MFNSSIYSSKFHDVLSSGGRSEALSYKRFPAEVKYSLDTTSLPSTRDYDGRGKSEKARLMIWRYFVEMPIF
jgi:hypothetical protein